MLESSNVLDFDSLCNRDDEGPRERRTAEGEGAGAGGAAGEGAVRRFSGNERMVEGEGDHNDDRALDPGAVDETRYVVGSVDTSSSFIGSRDAGDGKDAQEEHMRSMQGGKGENGVSFGRPSHDVEEVIGLEGCRDHFTLPVPSATVRFRDSTSSVRVYQGRYSQFLIQRDVVTVPGPGTGGGNGDGDSGRTEATLTMKRTADTTTSVRMLRILYTLVCLFFTAFLLVFCLEVLLFLAVDLTKNIEEWKERDTSGRGRFVGTLMAVPVFTHGFANLLVIAGLFTADTWGGSSLVMKLLGGDEMRSNVVTEWVTFGVYIAIPLIVMISTLFARNPDWWEITSLVWFTCVLIFYFLFAGAICLYETVTCFQLMRNFNLKENEKKPRLCLLAEIVHRRQRYRYGGNKSTAKLVKGEISSAISPSQRRFNKEGSERTMGGVSYLWFLLSKWKFLHTAESGGFLGLFRPLENPKRYPGTVEEMNSARPFITSHSWSLEKIFCRPAMSSYVAIIAGPGSLTRAQMYSSFACTLVGHSLILLLFASGLVWLGLEWTSTLILVLMVIVLHFIPMLLRTWRLYQMTSDLSRVRSDVKGQPRGREDDDFTGKTLRQGQQQHRDSSAALGVEACADNDDCVNGNEDSEAIYQVYHTHRITQATGRLCWIMFLIETVLLFLWPFGTIIAIGARKLAAFFFVVGLFSGVRYYLNAAIVLQEEGTFEMVDESVGVISKRLRARSISHHRNVDVEQRHQRWKTQSLVNNIVTNISKSRNQGVWVGVLTAFSFLFFAVVFGAVNEGETKAYALYQWEYLPDFYYPKQNGFGYPTCEVASGFTKGDSANREAILANSLLDYAFLAGVSYSDESIMTHQLDGWFGEGKTIDQVDLVRNHTEDYVGRGNQRTSASYKFITFPSHPNFGIISIRGTFSGIDTLVDAKLWMAAACMQMVRAVMPFGQMWTPILHRLVKVLSSLQSASIMEVAYYRMTSDFVEYLRNYTTYSELRVTGHSLGGGLAIITGAQTGTPAVALSGPNSMISRETYSPPVSIEALSTGTFNIIPDRDIVPRIDDRAPLYQKINCTASANKFGGCHDNIRSLCEIMYKCGTGERPALCICHLNYGYPKPLSDGTRSFEEACGTEPIDFNDLA